MKRLIWMPTFNCNLKCAHCCARSLPLETHKGHLSPQEWIDIFAQLKEPVDLMCVAGGEPSTYAGLNDILKSVPWHFAVDTNVKIHPQEWLTPDLYDRIDYVNPSLQFRPDHPRAEPEFWSRLRWLSENLPQRTEIYVSHVMTQHAHPIEEEQTLQGIAELNDSRIKHVKLNFDDTFMYRQRVPMQQGVVFSSCSSGKDVVVIFPEGSAFRCIGQAYYDIDCMGNVAKDGWGILLDEPKPCSKCFCTICDEYCVKVLAGQETEVEPEAVAVEEVCAPVCVVSEELVAETVVTEKPEPDSVIEDWVGFHAEDIERWGICSMWELISLPWPEGVSVMWWKDRDHNVYAGVGVQYGSTPAAQEIVLEEQAQKTDWAVADQKMKEAIELTMPEEWLSMRSAMTTHRTQRWLS